MPRKIKKLLLIFSIIALLPLFCFAGDDLNLDRLVNKKWYILAMKCPGGVEVHNKQSTFMQFYFSLELEPAVYNKCTSGKYVKVSTDEDTNPRQEGKYRISMDEIGRTLLTLTPTYGKPVIFSIKVVDDNYLTLVRISDSDEDKCRIHYAIAP